MRIIPHKVEEGAHEELSQGRHDSEDTWVPHIPTFSILLDIRRVPESVYTARGGQGAQDTLTS